MRGIVGRFVHASRLAAARDHASSRPLTRREGIIRLFGPIVGRFVAFAGVVALAVPVSPRIAGLWTSMIIQDRSHHEDVSRVTMPAGVVKWGNTS
ncbi:hypothetical protein DY240_05830 [Jiangella rhizosphaerae]|uniref:Uncharacterized protein n=1 Tax=Jiangella rhizosphaerae TaxID=2293569 RepID=A0A418KUH0_9ACTN|nr:hypothetical protein DY240_05830 [Jiangella rhizosphaerae]